MRAEAITSAAGQRVSGAAQSGAEGGGGSLDATDEGCPGRRRETAEGGRNARAGKEGREGWGTELCSAAIQIHTPVACSAAATALALFTKQQRRLG